MENNLTEIAFILDRSGSMDSMREEAIGGFNAFLENQQKDTDPVRLSLILFDHEYSPVLESLPVGDVRPLDEECYEPRGSTALLDAMGRTIDDLGKRLGAMPEADRPGQVIVVTLTDGMENASTDYTIRDVKDRIRHQEEKYSWEFIFLASDIRALNLSEVIGIKADSRVRYSKAAGGTARAFHVSEGLVNARKLASRRSQQQEEAGET